MRAVITVAMLSAAFDDAPATELGRILRDRNGKHVGLFCIEADWQPS